MQTYSKNFNLSLCFLLAGCASIINIENNLSREYQNSLYGKYLSASYSVRNGDTNYASKILNNKADFLDDKKLIELAFYTKIINGEFFKAENLKNNYNKTLDKNSFSNISKIAINIKNNNFEEALKNIAFSDDLPGFKILAKKIDHINFLKTVANKEKVLIPKIEDIYDLIIFEDFIKMNSLNYKILKKKHSNINKFLIFGYLKRNNLLEKEFGFFEKSLPFDYSKKFLLKRFHDENNLFSNKPSNNLIISSFLVNLANILSYEQNIPKSYLKMLLEIANFISPNQHFANYYLSKIYADEKNYIASLKKLEKVYKKSFVYVPSLIHKFYVSKLNKNLKSKIYFEEMENNYFSHLSVKLELANDYRKNNNCEKAIKIYDIILNETNHNSSLFYKASCLEKIGKWKDAKNLFLKIINLNKKDAYSLNYLSYSMAIRNEDLARANLLIKTALKLHPNNGYFLDTLGWVQYKMKNYDMAINNLQRAVSIKPNSSEIMDHLADCYIKKGRIQEAIFEWRRALKFDASKNLKKSIKLKLDKYDIK